MCVVLLWFLIFIPLVNLGPIGAADYSYSLRATPDCTTYEQGDIMRVVVDVSCKYLGDRPYSINEQVTVHVDISLDGAGIGHGTVPAGPLIINPGQTLTFHDTFMATIPSNAKCGTHTVNVTFSASALGMSESRTRSFSITVIEDEDAGYEESVLPPLLSLSLSPSESFPGGISTLTIRVYNPNTRDMDVRLSLYRLSFNDEFFLESVDIDISGMGTGEARSSYRAPEGLKSLGFKAVLKSYIVGHEQIIPNQPNMAECHATMLQRPLVTLINSLFDIKQSSGYITAKMSVTFENEYPWDECVLPNDGALSVLLPEGCSSAPLLVPLTMANLNDTFTFSLRIPESVECTTGSLSYSLSYPESYNSYPDDISVPFLLPCIETEPQITPSPTPVTTTLPPHQTLSSFDTLIEFLLSTPLGPFMGDALDALDTWVMEVVFG